MVYRDRSMQTADNCPYNSVSMDVIQEVAKACTYLLVGFEAYIEDFNCDLRRVMRKRVHVYKDFLSYLAFVNSD